MCNMLVNHPVVVDKGGDLGIDCYGGFRHTTIHLTADNGGDDAGEEAYCYAGQAGKGLLSIVYCRG